MSPDVKCTVDECKHWEKGNLCNATEIHIEMTKRAGDAIYTEMSDELTANGAKSKVQVAENTLCHTFRPKSS